jgi:hypothetical protein
LVNTVQDVPVLRTDLGHRQKQHHLDERNNAHDEQKEQEEIPGFTPLLTPERP